MKLETIKLGRIVNAHGIRGEVRVQPINQTPQFLTCFQTFLLDGVPVVPYRAPSISRRRPPSGLFILTFFRGYSILPSYETSDDGKQ